MDFSWRERVQAAYQKHSRSPVAAAGSAMAAAIEVISVVAVIVVTPSIASPSHLQGICELTAEKETCYLLLSRRRQFTLGESSGSCGWWLTVPLRRASRIPFSEVSIRFAERLKVTQ